MMSEAFQCYGRKKENGQKGEQRKQVTARYTTNITRIYVLISDMSQVPDYLKGRGRGRGSAGNSQSGSGTVQPGRGRASQLKTAQPKVGGLKTGNGEVFGVNNGLYVTHFRT